MESTLTPLFIFLNFIFFVIFGLLLKCIVSEIKLKISKKAVKILQISNLSMNNSILLVNLTQVLLVALLTTILKLGEHYFQLYPGQDYFLLCQGALLIKLSHITRDNLLHDISGVSSLTFLSYLLRLESGSLLELINIGISQIVIMIPVSVSIIVISVLVIIVMHLQHFATVIISAAIFVTQWIKNDHLSSKWRLLVRKCQPPRPNATPW